jgi:hypothetical protein
MKVYSLSSLPSIHPFIHGAGRADFATHVYTLICALLECLNN